MAKKSWWDKQQEKHAESPVETEVAHEPINEPVSGVPSRERQQIETAKTALSTTKTAVTDAAHAMSASGNTEARVAPSAPGGTITTKDGTFTAEEWAERNK